MKSAAQDWLRAFELTWKSVAMSIASVPAKHQGVCHACNHKETGFEHCYLFCEMVQRHRLGLRCVPVHAAADRWRARVVLRSVSRVGRAFEGVPSIHGDNRRRSFST